MTALNGKLPASALSPIPGGKLRKDAALRWNAMCAYQRAHKGVIPMPNGPASSYRTFAQQVVLKAQWTAQGKPQNAATPGHSNHGEGIAVDTNQGATVDTLSQFGFNKKYSDAPWEPWHRKWGGGGSTAGGQPSYDSVTIRKGTTGAAVKHLQVLLRGTGFLRSTWKAHTKYTLTVRRAVRAFQRKHKLPVDGVVGPGTWRAIRAEYDRQH